jgi:hypothetical protein
MSTTLARKLGIQPHQELLLINAPDSFASSLSPLPPGVSLVQEAVQPHQVHWFADTRGELCSRVDAVLSCLKGNSICWVYFPKGTSGIQTDLTRDKGWECLEEKELHWLKLVSFDATWSARSFRKGKAEKGASRLADGTVLQYIDRATRTVLLPQDLEAALQSHNEALAFFQSLSFTNRKEYVEWIVSAKREETRSSRVAQVVVKLGQGLKNPSGR